MKWKQWKMGLLVAALTGACTVLAVGVIVPSMTWQEGALILAGSVAKDILLYLKTHPLTALELKACERRGPD